MTLTEVTNPNCGYLKEFEHVVDLNNNGVPSRYIEWCDANCEDHWGWHFWQNDRANQMTSIGMNLSNVPLWIPSKKVVKGAKAFMSFASYDEMIQFKIINLSG